MKTLDISKNSKEYKFLALLIRGSTDKPLKWHQEPNDSCQWYRAIILRFMQLVAYSTLYFSIAFSLMKSIICFFILLQTQPFFSSVGVTRDTFLQHYESIFGVWTTFCLIMIFAAIILAATILVAIFVGMVIMLLNAGYEKVYTKVSNTNQIEVKEPSALQKIIEAKINKYCIPVKIIDTNDN